MCRDPQAGEVMIKTHSTSLNPADWKSAEGEQAALLSFDWPRVFGFDFAGTVHSIGSDLSIFKVGDPVFGMIQGLPERDRGTLQEYFVVNEKVCASKPENVTMSQAAALPLVCITAVKMCEACGLTPTTKEVTASAVLIEETKGATNGGLRVLVTGGAGGVGVHAIQIVKNLFGATYVVTTASAGVKTNLCKRVGADLVINYKESKFEKVLADEEKFDVILDCTGEASKCVTLLKEGGGMCSILAGPTAEALQTWLREGEWPTSKITFGVHSFLHSSCGGSLFQFFGGGTSLVSKCQNEGASFAHVIGTGNGRIMKMLENAVKNNLLEAIIDKEYMLKDSMEAILYQKAGRCAGKVVVNVVST